MSTCTVSFSAVDPTLSVLPNARLVFRPHPAVIRGAGAQVMSPDEETVVASGSGTGSIALAPGKYILTLTANLGQRQAEIVVPDAATALLGDLIDSPIGAWEFSELQALRTDVTTAAGQVALDRGAVLADRTLTETARAAAVAAAPVATGAAAEALVYRDQAAIYAGLMGADMTLEWPDQLLADGRWDTGLRFPVTNALTGGTVQMSVVSSWQVSSLFAGGAAPAWFDFTTPGRAFQDLLGTPVTAAGHSIGMWRDAVTPLTFGPNLVVNGDFANGLTGWGGSGWTPSSGAALKTIGNASSLTQVIALTAGRTYRISGTATVTAGTVTPRLTGGTAVTAPAVTASGAWERYITAGTGNTTVDLLADAAFAGALDNIRVEELQGIVILQPNFGARGTWATAPVTGRRNQLTFTEAFDNPAWIKTAVGTGVAPVVTPNADVAPDGTLTADRIDFNRGAGTSGSDTSLITRPIVNAGLGLAGSIYVKAGTPADVGKTILFRHATGAAYTTITLTAEWVRAINISTGSGTDFQIAARSPSSQTVSVLLWGAQLEPGAVVTPYQRVASTHDVSEAGIASAGFVRLDGSDDSLPIRLPAPVAMGDLVVATKPGIWREPFSGSSFAIGPTTTPGTNSIAGGLFSEPEFRDIVAVGVVQDMSADEWLRLRRWLQARGSGGELCAGPNLLINGDGSNGVVGWTSDPAAPATVANVGGQLRVTATEPFGAVTQTVPTEIGSLYLLRGTFSGAGSPYLSASVPGRASPYTFNSGAGMLFRTVASNAVTVRLNMGVAGTGEFDNISLQKLNVVAS